MADLTDPNPTALVVEAVRKAQLAWVAFQDGRAHPLWCVVVNEVLAAVTGPREQRNPGLRDGTAVCLSVRSKERGTRIGTVECQVLKLPVGDRWDDVGMQLLAHRLNVHDAPSALPRWRNECDVWLLTPQRLVESPAALSTDDGRTTPAPTSATTPATLPRLFARRRRALVRGRNDDLAGGHGNH